jgi:hypothetical protein
MLISMEDLLELLSPTTDGFDIPCTHDLRAISSITIDFWSSNAFKYLPVGNSIPPYPD